MCRGFVGWWRMHQACLVCVCPRDIFARVLFFFLFLHLFDVRVIGRIVFDLTCNLRLREFCHGQKV